MEYLLFAGLKDKGVQKDDNRERIRVTCATSNHLWEGGRGGVPKSSWKTYSMKKLYVDLTKFLYQNKLVLLNMFL